MAFAYWLTICLNICNDDVADNRFDFEISAFVQTAKVGERPIGLQFHVTMWDVAATNGVFPEWLAALLFFYGPNTYF